MEFWNIICLINKWPKVGAWYWLCVCVVDEAGKMEERYPARILLSQGGSQGCARESGVMPPHITAFCFVLIQLGFRNRRPVAVLRGIRHIPDRKAEAPGKADPELKGRSSSLWAAPLHTAGDGRHLSRLTAEGSLLQDALSVFNCVWLYNCDAVENVT